MLHDVLSRLRTASQVYLRPLLGFVLLLWGIELIDLVLLGRLDFLGIFPRNLQGLRGVLFAPLLHGGFGHLVANTGPLLALGLLTLLGGWEIFLRVTASAWLIGGLGTWLLGGAGTVHIGSSILIFGYLGYLLAAAYYQRSPQTLLVALLVGLVYGSMLFGLLPGQTGVSWQGHAAGFLGGVLAARGGIEKQEASSK